MVARAFLYTMFSLTAIAFSIYWIYIILTPVQNNFFNTVSNFLHMNPGAVSSNGQTQINNLISSANIEWNILFVVGIVGCGAIIWLAAFRNEAQESVEDYEYEY